MRIERTNSIGSSMATRKSAAADAAGFVISTGTTNGASASASARPASALASMDALLAAQWVETPEEKQERAKKRGHNLLDLLDEIRVAGLTGQLSKDHLARLTLMLRTNGDSSGDEGLDMLLGEIELRAEVERAKMEMVA